jgi:hypothetical protein
MAKDRKFTNYLFPKAYPVLSAQIKLTVSAPGLGANEAYWILQGHSFEQNCLLKH